MNSSPGGPAQARCLFLGRRTLSGRGIGRNIDPQRSDLRVQERRCRSPLPRAPLCNSQRECSVSRPARHLAAVQCGTGECCCPNSAPCICTGIRASNRAEQPLPEPAACGFCVQARALTRFERSRPRGCVRSNLCPCLFLYCVYPCLSPVMKAAERHVLA